MRALDGLRSGNRSRVGEATPSGLWQERQSAFSRTGKAVGEGERLCVRGWGKNRAEEERHYESEIWPPMNTDKRRSEARIERNRRRRVAVMPRHSGSLIRNLA